MLFMKIRIIFMIITNMRDMMTTKDMMTMTTTKVTEVMRGMTMVYMTLIFGSTL